MNEHVALQVPPGASDGYDVDFHAWSVRQVALLRQGRTDCADIDNIAEEIENLARRELHSVERRMRTLIEHLLKLKFFILFEEPRRGWRVTVAKSRDNLAATFRDSPSLFAQRETIFLNEWPAGARVAALAVSDDRHAVTSIEAVRGQPAFTLDEALDPTFFPGD